MEFWAEIQSLRAEVGQLKQDRDDADRDVEILQAVVKRQDTELVRLRARLCYVNPDGSHVRGCAQHEAQHPAQWCESR